MDAPEAACRCAPVRAHLVAKPDGQRARFTAGDFAGRKICGVRGRERGSSCASVAAGGGRREHPDRAARRRRVWRTDLFAGRQFALLRAVSAQQPKVRRPVRDPRAGRQAAPGGFGCGQPARPLAGRTAHGLHPAGHQAIGDAADDGEHRRHRGVGPGGPAAQPGRVRGGVRRARGGAGVVAGWKDDRCGRPRGPRRIVESCRRTGGHRERRRREDQRVRPEGP